MKCTIQLLNIATYFPTSYFDTEIVVTFVLHPDMLGGQQKIAGFDRENVLDDRQ